MKTFSENFLHLRGIVVHDRSLHRMTLHDLSFAFVDIETTGGNAVRDRVLEIAVIIVEGNAIGRPDRIRRVRPAPAMRG